MATVTAVAKIGGAENGGHAAAGDDAFDAVMIELVAGVDGNPRERASGKRKAAASPELAQPVGPPAVHAHAFHAANADQLQR